MLFFAEPLVLNQALFRQALSNALADEDNGVRNFADLARIAGVTRSMVHLVSRGYAPTRETRRRIAAALKVDERELWRREVNGGVQARDGSEE